MKRGPHGPLRERAVCRRASPEGCVGLQRTEHGTKEQEDGAGPPPGGAAGIPPRASLSRQPRPEASQQG